MPVPTEMLLALDAEQPEPELLLVLLDDLLELVTLLEILELLSELLTLLEALLDELLAEDMLLELCCDDELETEDIAELVLTLPPTSLDEELDGFAASPPLHALKSRVVMESTIMRY